VVLRTEQRMAVTQTAENIVVRKKRNANVKEILSKIFLTIDNVSYS